MTYEVWKIGDETDHIITTYTGDSALKFIYDRMIFEVM